MALWTKKEIIILNDNYGKIKFFDLILMLPGRTSGAIRRKAYDNGLVANLSITNKKFVTTNNNFFSVPNTINSYWAGFIAADGCVSELFIYLSV